MSERGVGFICADTARGARVAGEVRGLVELLEDAVPEVVAARDAYDAGRPDPV